MRSVCFIQQQDTSNNIKDRVLHNNELWRIKLADDHKMYSSLQVTCCLLLSDYSQVWSFWTDFRKSWLVSNVKDIRPVEATLIRMQDEITV